MSANMELAKARNISESNIDHINAIHDALEKMIECYSLECDYDSVIEMFHFAEFTLQELWGFTRDARYHTWVNRLTQQHLNLMYGGRTFWCNDSKVKRTLTGPFHQGQLIGVGEGFIDINVAYHRKVGNITELVQIPLEMPTIVPA